MLDFHFQAVESASCGSVDSREPCCYEPPEEDTGRVNNEFAFRLSYIYSMPASEMECLVTKCKARKRFPILMCFVPF